MRGGAVLCITQILILESRVDHENTVRAHNIWEAITIGYNTRQATLRAGFHAPVQAAMCENLNVQKMASIAKTDKIPCMYISKKSNCDVAHAQNGQSD